MISSAEEFKYLRESEKQQEYSRAATDEASIEVWKEILAKFPDLAFWVAHNKTVPIEILEILSRNSCPKVRDMVARKRKLTEGIMLILAKDTDPSVRLALANNKKITNNVASILANDTWQNIRDVINERYAF